jgi:hypothetical protein
MATERTDTGGKGLRVGRYVFTVSEAPIRGAFASGAVYDEWFFTVLADNELKPHKERIPVWKLGPLLGALGQKEVSPEVFEWDRDKVTGLQFEAEIVMERDRKDASKSYARLSNPKRVGSAAKVAADDSVPF